LPECDVKLGVATFGKRGVIIGGARFDRGCKVGSVRLDRIERRL
jgi:hypothetical protein